MWLCFGGCFILGLLYIQYDFVGWDCVVGQCKVGIVQCGCDQMCYIVVQYVYGVVFVLFDLVIVGCRYIVVFGKFQQCFGCCCLYCVFVVVVEFDFECFIVGGGQLDWRVEFFVEDVEIWYVMVF